MNKIMIVTMLALISTQANAGKIISKEDAETILRATIKNTPGCFVLKEFSAFPVVIEEDTLSKRRELDALMALVDAGILQSEKKQVEFNKQIAFGMSQKVKVSAFSFSMTDKGKGFYRKNAVQISKGRAEPKTGPGFCYADKLQVTGINRFIGSAVIDYYIQAVNKADWANNKRVIRAGMIVDKNSMGIKTFRLKGQPKPPPGIKVQARFRKQKDGEFTLTYY